ncbi:MAG: hypothetical protein ACD_40C00057G0009 [uncultured bacterium]|nr:MAG: hypothetical protein ACD_40C00057G0009 [uncultured bacterium]KKU25341.1 MAG: hypothetical protein UX37_C0026G0003 [Microgenomates group bacterium GW2011_GWA2_46_16]
MTNTNRFECKLTDGVISEDSITVPIQVDTVSVTGANDLHLIPDKCPGCRVGYLPQGQPRVVSAIGPEIWRCKTTDDCYLDEQLTIAVVLNLSPEIITKLIEEVHENEQRRVKWMYESYFEPETLTLLRHQGVYPYPVPESEG